MAQWVAAARPELVFVCPQLPPSPAAAMALIEQLTAHWPSAGTALIGSSLGGYYATALAESSRFQRSQVLLLNPAVNPARDLAHYIGEQSCWQDPTEHFFFRPEFVAELQALQSATLSRPERYLAVIAQGDEVLDWHEMQARYLLCQIKLLAGSDHGLSDFDDYLPELIGFLRL
jgi:predicted esterase YcpF (UPF0227 family)